ncbi:MAG: DUF4359 domain-containing protein [Prevotella sp.]|nr:DUF4359 domain-containing protein [Prevotella sp.]
MKQLISILIIVVVLATLALTCPDKQSHVEAINNEFITAVDHRMNNSSSSEENSFEEGLKIVASSFVGGLFKGVMEQQLMVKNYVVVSIGEVNSSEGRKILSFGICNHVFTLFSSEDLIERMKESNM